jgi:hypothetical protein
MDREGAEASEGRAKEKSNDTVHAFNPESETLFTGVGGDPGIIIFKCSQGTLMRSQA